MYNGEFSVTTGACRDISQSVSCGETSHLPQTVEIMQREAIFRMAQVLHRVALLGRLTPTPQRTFVRCITQTHQKPAVAPRSSSEKGKASGDPNVGSPLANGDPGERAPFRSTIDVAKLFDDTSDRRPRGMGLKRYRETENDGLREGLLQLPKYAKTFMTTPGRVSLPASQAKSLREQMCCADQLEDVRAVIRLMSDVACLASIARGKLMEDRAFEAFAEHVVSRLQNSHELTFNDLQQLLKSFHRFHFELMPHTLTSSALFRNVIDVKCVEMLPYLSKEEGFILSDLWFLASCSRLAEFPQKFIEKMQKTISQMTSQDVKITSHSSNSTPNETKMTSPDGKLTSYDNKMTSQDVSVTSRDGPVMSRDGRMTSREVVTPSDVVRLLLAVALQRKVSPDLMQQVEKILSSHLPSLSEAELGVVCAGFFKTQTTPSQDFVEKVLSRLLTVESYGAPNDVTTAIFAKFLVRYSVAMREPLQRFLTKNQSKMASLDIPALGHLCAIMETTLFLDEDFLFRICQKLLSEMPNVRLKDLAKIANVCSFFNYRPVVQGEDFFHVLQKMAEKTVKLEDVSVYPSKLIELLAAFAQMGVFSKPLLSFMTVPAFWKTYLGQPKSLLASNALLQLHFAVELEHPEFRKPLIRPDVLNSIIKEEEKRAAALSTAVISLFNGLQTLLKDGEKSADVPSVALFTPLPYAEPMLVVRLKDLNPLPLPEDLCQTEFRDCLRRAPNDGTCAVILHHPWWDYTNPLQRLTGLCEMKIRHLKALNYSVINVNQSNTQEMTFVKKVKFLRDKLFFERAEISVPLEYVPQKKEQQRRGNELK